MYSRLIRAAAIAVCVFLAACGPNDETSVEGGGCKLVPPPTHNPVCGQTAEDQNWLDTVRTRVGAACRWERHPDKPCVRIVIDPEQITPEQRAAIDKILHPEKKLTAKERTTLDRWWRRWKKK